MHTKSNTIRYIDIFRVALGNILGNKLRSFLTILGISVGIGAVVFLVSFGFGLQKLTINKIISSSAVTTIDVSQPLSTVLRLNDETLNRFKNISGVEMVSPISSQPSQVSLETITTDIIALGIEDQYFKLEQPKFVAGNKFAKNDDIVISDAVAKLLTIENPIDILNQKIAIKLFLALGENGQTLEQKEIEVKVVGVVENPSGIVYLPLKILTDYGVKEYSQIKVKAKEVDSVELVKKTISDLGFQANSVSDVIVEINDAFRVIQYVLAGFGLIALLVASIGMFNTMTIALLERTKDIGVMKALGARNRDIRKIFVVEAIMIAFSGGIIGIALAMLLAGIITTGLNLLISAAKGESITLFVFNWEFLVAILGLTLIVGLITGIYPARRASKLNPLNALRYE